jgi:predicted nucleic acid-binding Zn finger protein
MLKAITYILENDASVQGSVGLNAAGTKYKIYPVIAPETEKAPYCICRIFSKEEGAKDCGYIWTIEVTTYASSYDKVTEINDYVIDAIKSQAAGTVNGLSFGWANFNNESDGFERDHDLYSKSTSFLVHGL